MDNKEAIARIKNLISMIKSPRTILPYCQEELDALDLAIKTLEADRWIPVTERLPNTLGVYNVIKKMTEGKTVYVISTACYFDGQNTWHDDNRVNHSRPYPDVIAWKPKPEPYESEDQ